MQAYFFQGIKANAQLWHLLLTSALHSSKNSVSDSINISHVDYIYSKNPSNYFIFIPKLYTFFVVSMACHLQTTSIDIFGKKCSNFGIKKESKSNNRITESRESTKKESKSEKRGNEKTYKWKDKEK